MESRESGIDPSQPARGGLRRVFSNPGVFFAAAALLAVYTFVAPQLGRMRSAGDRRPVGGVEDIQDLASRKDLNVLFILIDTLRADRLGAYGYERNTSPVLDRISNRGVRFARHLSQSSWTKCSMASLWTSLYPNRSGVKEFDEIISPGARMPAEVFSDAGYRTAGIFRNGWVSGYFGFDQGFDAYLRPFPEPVDRGIRVENPTVSLGGSDIDIATTAIEFLRLHESERWFLYLHLMDIHEYVYSEETALFGTSYSDIYDNSILWVNGVLGGLFDYLAEAGFLENTLVIITSDHGEAFLERGFEGHARHVYRETTEVPLIISFPFRLEAPAVIESRSAGVDLWPTIYELVGLTESQERDGRSFVPEILDAVNGQRVGSDEPSAPRYAYLDQNWGSRQTVESPTLSVVEGSRRYVVYRDDEGKTTDEFLFDGATDPAELDDLSGTDVEALKKMRELADDYLAVEESPFETPTRLELDEMQLNQLRALGYDLP